jgi:hypothetical protein
MKKRLAIVVLLLVGGYFLFAYVFMPWDWRRYEASHPGLENAPRVTHTGSGIPGDPLNVALIGTHEQVLRAMHRAGWYPADPITLDSSLRIAIDTVLHRSYDQAPVSNLYLWGRKEDLAFELPVGDDPKQRHHVRFWKSEKTDGSGRHAWIGAATFDHSIGFSHDTGQITHHIAPDIDTERDHVIGSLRQAGTLEKVQWVDDFHQHRTGKNGGGDPYHTDGRLEVGVLVAVTPAR